jgi:DNA adenine methylase
LTDLDPKTNDDIVRVGFSKLAAHKLSYGTLGVMTATCRRDEDMWKNWTPDNICQKINDLHPYLKRKDVRLTHSDYSKLITDDREPALLYLDPPYFEQGTNCYQHSFRYDDHIRLSELLKNTSHDWVLSYDDNPTIHKLYEGWSNVSKVRAKYSVAGHKAETELLISSL